MIRPGFHDGALFLTPVESIKRREAEKVRGLPEAGSNSHNRAQQGRLTGGARQGAVPGQGRYRARPGRSREVQSILSAPRRKIDSEWVITSYLAANAIILPMSGWLAMRLGRRNYFLASIAVFTIASAMCGMGWF